MVPIVWAIRPSAGGMTASRMTSRPQRTGQNPVLPRWEWHKKLQLSGKLFFKIADRLSGKLLPKSMPRLTGCSGMIWKWGKHQPSGSLICWLTQRSRGVFSEPGKVSRWSEHMQTQFDTLWLKMNPGFFVGTQNPSRHPCNALTEVNPIQRKSDLKCPCSTSCLWSFLMSKESFSSALCPMDLASEDSSTERFWPSSCMLCAEEDHSCGGTMTAGLSFMMKPLHTVPDQWLPSSATLLSESSPILDTLRTCLCWTIGFLPRWRRQSDVCITGIWMPWRPVWMQQSQRFLKQNSRKQWKDIHNASGSASRHTETTLSKTDWPVGRTLTLLVDMFVQFDNSFVLLWTI